MRRKICAPLVVLGLAGLVGCGGGAGGGGETATLTGTLGSSGAARVAARSAPAASGTYYVEAVDDDGATQDAAQGLELGDRFELHVPPGHVYVIVVGDASGPLGAMIHDPVSDRADFLVDRPGMHLALGTLDVDPWMRRVHARGDGDPLEHPSHMGPPADSDGDHIPDFADRDDDNDGIEDHHDRMHGADRSRDHDNDGLSDRDDPDDDGDGVPDADDYDPVTGRDRSRDHDNDGLDDDRQLGRPGDAAAGAQVYAEAGCAACHGADGSGTSVHGESIRNASAHELAEVLLQGEEEQEEDGEEDGGEFMPAFPELVGSAADLAAFLRSDGSTAGPGDSGPPDTAPGGQTPPSPPDAEGIYAGVCAGCHRLGAYDPQGFAPDLSGLGSRVPSRFSGGAHHGHTLSADEAAAVAAYVDAL
ncbi:MAG: hypothetical protein Kow0092_31940 [Deferrisomatales bacterium]